jgi:hypothetical protein
MSKTLDSILQKQVTRKEFLQFAGTALITLLGFSNFVHLLTRFAHTGSQASVTTEQKSRSGFGSSRFGV